MIFVYDGDQGDPLVWWFRKRLQAIGRCYEADLPEASLVLLYSGIDTFGWLDAPPGTTKATRRTFVPWCKKYIVGRLNSIGGKSSTATDLYAARCGILHNSSAASDLGRGGISSEIYYRFEGKDGVNLGANVQVKPLVVEIGHFAQSFKEGGMEFLKEIKEDSIRAEIAANRARSFFKWGKIEGDE